jgi:hypothetical protein
MMEELHVALTYLFLCAVYLLAPALRALRSLSEADAWLWLVRASTCETATPLGVVLFHDLSDFLLSTGAEVFRHG